MARKTLKPTKLLLAATFLLTVFGLVILTSYSVPLSQQNFSESYYYLRHQFLFGFLVGLALFFVARKIKPSFFKSLAVPLFFLTVVLLLLVFVPSLGYEAGGARRWLALGSLSFQPSELAKLALILYLAAWFAKRRQQIVGKLSSLIHFLIIVGSVSIIVVFQKDLGTAALLVFVALTMYLAAGARLRAVVASLLIVTIALGVFIAIEPYRADRVTTFFNPASDTQGSSYQLNQALIAIGSGGFFGRGLGHSVQKYQFLPESIGDSIFAIIGEEFGFFGTLIFLTLFLVFLLAGFKIAQGARTMFGAFVTIGIISWIGIQAFMNVGGIIGLIPFTGIPLPFISYGGTALAMELAAVGIVASVARH